MTDTADNTVSDLTRTGGGLAIILPVVLLTMVVEMTFMIVSILVEPDLGPLGHAVSDAALLGMTIGPIYGVLLYRSGRGEGRMTMGLFLPTISMASILATFEVSIHPFLEFVAPSLGDTTISAVDSTIAAVIAGVVAAWFEKIDRSAAASETGGRSDPGRLYRQVLGGILAVMALAALVNAAPGFGAFMSRSADDGNTTMIDLTLRQRTLAQRIGRLANNLVYVDPGNRESIRLMTLTAADIREESDEIETLIFAYRTANERYFNADRFEQTLNDAASHRQVMLSATAHFIEAMGEPDTARRVTLSRELQRRVDSYVKSEGAVMAQLREAIMASRAEHDQLWYAWFFMSPVALFVIGMTTLAPIASILRAQDQRINARADTYEKLITAVGHSRSAILLIDGTGKVTWVNSGLFNILGFDEKNAIGRTLDELMMSCRAGSDLRHTLRDAIRTRNAVSTGGPVTSLSGQMRHLDIEIQIAEEVAGAEGGHIAILSDVTDEINMRNFLEAIFQGVAEGIIIQRSNGEIIAANPEAGRLLGVPHERLIGLSSYAPEWRGRDDNGNPINEHSHPAIRALRQGEPIKGTVLSVDLAGNHRRWILVDCTLAVDPTTHGRIVITSFSDITLEREREQDLREARDAAERNLAQLKSYQTALDEHAIVSVTDTHGMITDVNEAFLAISGFLREEVIGQNHRIVNSGTHPEAFFRTMWSDLLAGKSWSSEVCNRAKDGSLYWVDTTIIPVKGHDGVISSFVAIRYDITERVEAQTALMASTELAETKSAELEMTLAHMNQGISAYDNEVRITIWNEKYAEMFGLKPEQVETGMRLEELLFMQKRNGDFEGDPKAFVEAIREHVRRGEVFEDICLLRGGRLIKTIHSPTPDGGHVATHEDVTEREQANAAIQHAAEHDLLTGLPNRINITGRVAAALQDTAERGERFSVMLIDLDRFKAVNDTFGHAMGDKLLQAAAERMLQCVRGRDIVARLGGDEFAIYFSTSNDQEAVTRKIAQRLINSLSAPYDIDGRTLNIGASIGAAIAPDHGKTVDALFQAADFALYHVKANGRQAWRIFDDELAFMARDRRKLETDLRQAIERDELSLHYQPYLAARDGQVAGVEGLLRWQHPERGLVPPDLFIPIAEDSGLIRDIGHWVIRRAAQDAAHWPDSVRVAVNASVAQFGHGDIVRSVRDALSQHHVDPARFEIEVTETVLLRENPVMLEELERLKDMRIAIALDDFGTGYSSLKHLKMFPFDKIKIDRSFVSDMLDNPQSAAIVGALASLARSLDMSVTAEGVETQDQLEILKLAGCTYAQGYHISRPLPFDEITAFINRHNAANGRNGFRVVS